MVEDSEEEGNDCFVDLFVYTKSVASSCLVVGSDRAVKMVGDSAKTGNRTAMVSERDTVGYGQRADEEAGRRDS